jgi:hypothetical protein
MPGDTAVWSFTMKADPVNWVTTISSFLLSESDPTFGTYYDMIGGLGGPVNAVLAPGSPDWSDTLGQYAFSPSPVTNGNSAVVRVLYEEYSGDPSTCPVCYLGSNFLDVPVSAVTAPEPGTWALLLAGGAVLALARRRVTRRTPLP